MRHDRPRAARPIRGRLMTIQTVTIPVPAVWWMSANQRGHWRTRATKTHEVRSIALLLGRQHLRPVTRAHVTVQVCYPRKSHADPANAYPTIKAAVDGLVDAGIFPDDDHEHLIGPDMRMGPTTKQTGQYALIFEIKEVAS